MRHFFIAVAAWLCAMGAAAQDPATAWATVYPAIEKSIQAPSFPDREYRLFDYGKPSKKEGYLYTDLINSVIDRCSREGGGRVVIPEGTWLTGPLTLKSNVDLHLSEGATLLFTDDLSQYPLVPTRWEGMDCWNYQPMVYAYEATNIAITGKGTIDGGARNENWWRMCGAKKYGWEEGVLSQRVGRPKLMEWNEAGVEMDERRMGDGYGMRPQLVNPVKCSNVLIEDVTLLRSPFWVIHPLLCNNVTVRRVRIQNDGPNGDGCDPESCDGVLIEDCYFDTGDDCIAIKSGRNGDGRRWNTPSRNIIVRDCKMKNGHGGVVIGSEISGGFNNLFVERCVMDSPDLDRVIRIKTNTCRGGVIEKVYVRDVEVGRCREAVLKINLVYESKEACRRDFAPTVRDVFIERVNCRESKYGVKIDAFEDICNVSNIRVKDCDWTGVSTGANSVNGLTEGVVLENVTINGAPAIETLPVSERMALSEMRRNPLSWQVDHSRRLNWSYSVGTELDAFFDLADRYANDSVRAYALSYIDSLVAADGTMYRYKPEDFKLDDVKNGTLLLRAYDLTGEERYRLAADKLYAQLLNQPRTKDGGFWHKRVYPRQMWLDGLFMQAPFYTMYANRYLSGKEQKKAYDDIARQLLTVAKHTYDPATGLYRHAWDESKKMFWADKKTGQSAHAWGRAQGWFIWAIVDVLREMPADHKKRPELVKLLHSVADGLLKYQDVPTGLWYQVLDEPDTKGNYLEATASAMYAYNILRATRLGLLEPYYREAAEKAYAGILDRFVTTAPDGSLSLTGCCAVAGLGGGSSQRRDGSFEYYISEPVRDNDAKGVGPFILAALEMER